MFLFFYSFAHRDDLIYIFFYKARTDCMFCLCAVKVDRDIGRFFGEKLC